MDCELWKYFSEFARPSHVLHVHSQKDVTTLRKAVGHWRLIVVHAARLLNTVAWIVQSHESNSLARPTIFSRSVPESIDDLPVPLLVLRSTGNLPTSATIPATPETYPDFARRTTSFPETVIAARQ